MPHYRLKQNGFTLLELLVVIAIIGVLSSIVLTSVGSARSKTRDALRKSDMKQMQTALNMYFNDNGVYPTTGGNWQGYLTTGCGPAGRTLTGSTGYIPDVAPQYISALPVDPSRTFGSCNGYLYRSDAVQYALLDHAVPESYPAPGASFYDPLRPTWAWKLCETATACLW